MKFIRSGKVKDIYLREDGAILFVFTNRVTAFDGRKKALYKNKGEICCTLSCFWFEKLQEAEIKTHFTEYVPPNVLVAKEVSIIPVEVIGRNFLYGSLWKRYEREELDIGSDFLTQKGEKKAGMSLTKTLLEFTTKFETLDKPIREKEIIEREWAGKNEVEHIKKETRRIGDLMRDYLAQRGIILADFKLEYGKTKEGDIVLADEVGTPDVCRFWDMKAYEGGEIMSLDKDVFREGKGNLSDVYLGVYKRITGE